MSYPKATLYCFPALILAFSVLTAVAVTTAVGTELPGVPLPTVTLTFNPNQYGWHVLKRISKNTVLIFSK